MRATIKVASPTCFPNVHCVLNLLVAPVTTATMERGHSALGHIKIDLRNALGQDCLNALILLFVHKDIALDHQQVVARFAKKHPRRMLLVDPVGGD